MCVCVCMRTSSKIRIICFTIRWGIFKFLQPSPYFLDFLPRSRDSCSVFYSQRTKIYDLYKFLSLFSPVPRRNIFNLFNATFFHGFVNIRGIDDSAANFVVCVFYIQCNIDLNLKNSVRRKFMRRKAYIIRLGCVFIIFGREISMVEDFIQFPKCFSSFSLAFAPTIRASFPQIPSFLTLVLVVVFSSPIPVFACISRTCSLAREKDENKQFLWHLIDLLKPRSFIVRMFFSSLFWLHLSATSLQHWHYRMKFRTWDLFYLITFPGNDIYLLGMSFPQNDFNSVSHTQSHLLRNACIKIDIVELKLLSHSSYFILFTWTALKWWSILHILGHFFFYC